MQMSASRETKQAEGPGARAILAVDPAPPRPWTGADDQEILAMRAAGAKPASIAQMVNRSYQAVINRLNRLKKPRQPPAAPAKRFGVSDHHFVKPAHIITTRRKCMCCPTIFDSWGPGNRLCDPCRYGDDTGTMVQT